MKAIRDSCLTRFNVLHIMDLTVCGKVSWFFSLGEFQVVEILQKASQKKEESGNGKKF